MLGLEGIWNCHGEKAQRSQQQTAHSSHCVQPHTRALRTHTLQAIHSLCVNLGREELLGNMKSGGGSGQGRRSRELRKPSIGTHRAVTCARDPCWPWGRTHQPPQDGPGGGAEGAPVQAGTELSGAAVVGSVGPGHNGPQSEAYWNRTEKVMTKQMSA